MFREDHGEALTGDTTGWAIEPRNTIPDADAVQLVEGNTRHGAIASRAAIRRGRRPQHVETFFLVFPSWQDLLTTLAFAHPPSQAP